MSHRATLANLTRIASLLRRPARGSIAKALHPLADAPPARSEGRFFDVKPREPRRFLYGERFRFFFTVQPLRDIGVRPRFHPQLKTPCRRRGPRRHPSAPKIDPFFIAPRGRLTLEGSEKDLKNVPQPRLLSRFDRIDHTKRPRRRLWAAPTSALLQCPQLARSLPGRPILLPAVAMCHACLANTHRPDSLGLGASPRPIRRS